VLHGHIVEVLRFAAHVALRVEVVHGLLTTNAYRLSC
jgi:hypothetical protein